MVNLFISVSILLLFYIVTHGASLDTLMSFITGFLLLAGTYLVATLFGFTK